MDPSGKMLFTCNACGYRARIPERYSGKEVHCPRCQVVQVAQVGIGGNMTGQTLTFQNLKAAYVGEQTAMKSVEKPDDTVRFHCDACKYTASLAAKHAGTSIRCPGCGASQAVAAKADGGAAKAGDTGSFAAPKTPVNEDRILFTCGDCAYKARIPARYSGRSVLCPGCGKAVPASATVAAQVANLETAPAPTGNTTILNRVTATPALDGQPQTGALTRVGMQFTCRNCGYQSRISPSCAGGVIYCPSCRGEQLVDMGGGVASTPASEALERRAGKDDKDEDAIEPTITPARGNRAISGPLPAVEAEKKKSSPLQIVDDEAPVARPASGAYAAVAPVAKAAAAAKAAPTLAEEGRTPSGRFPASVAPFSAEPMPLPQTGSHKASASDRRTAKTAPLTAVTPSKGIPVAKVPLAKDAVDDDESLAAEARSLARRSVPPATAIPAATTPASSEAVKPAARAIAAKPKPMREASANAGAAEASSASSSSAKGPSSRNRGMWAAVALLMMAVAALGVITWQWDLKSKALTTEQGQHTATRGQLVTEQTAHVATRADLSTTQDKLAGEEKVHALTRERLVVSEAAHTKATTELGLVRDELSLTRRQLGATKNELATLQSALDEQTEARQAADTRFDELDARWQDAKQRLGDLLEPAGTKIATPAPKAAVAPAPVPKTAVDKDSAKHEF